MILDSNPRGLMHPRTMRATAALFALTLLPAACVLSTDAVVSERDALFDPRLIGTWEAPADTDRVVVTRGQGNSYVFAFTNKKDGVARYVGRLGRLGNRTVLDVWPEEPSLDAPTGELFVAHHLIFDVEIADDEIRSALLEVDSLRAAIRSGRMGRGHEVSNNRLVLSGTTEELRAALGPYVMRPGVFTTPTVWQRVRPPGS